MTNWSDAILASLATASALLFSSIPRIMGFAVILIVGWIIAAVVARALAALLRTAHFDGFSERAGLSGLLQRGGGKQSASAIVAGIAKWFIRLITLMVAFDALGLPAVSDVLRQLLMWLPNLVVALVALIIGGIAANALSEVVLNAAVKGELENPPLLAAVARNAVWAFAIVVAINQIGVAATLVNIFFIGVVGTFALALGLSFGLGGRDVAGALLRRWQARQQGQAGHLLQGAGEAANQDQSYPSEFTGNERRRSLGDRRSEYAGRA
ncbi:mechanosensitive ion channel family protein [Rugamonas violacea]|uniref:mechanosensitive ion channel family protein n=1 Tax=Rugamonas sp. CCM 8940 TaxID=2765359 RepID=UPI001F4130E4|nr:small-conductance mechanosensitive ion channel [Rugamonas sp. CCM 8940]